MSNYKQVLDYSVNELYPNTMLVYKDKTVKPLTKQQIFDLQFKWNLDYCTDLEEYWTYPAYWNGICSYRQLSEEFLREYIDQIDWAAISFHQELSEEFIREFKDKLNLRAVLYTHTLPLKLRFELEGIIKGRIK